MISVTRVEATPDLRYAKVFVSFLDAARAPEAMKGLKSASGYLRRELGAALQLRYTPELQWQEDDSITRGAHMLELLGSLNIPKDDEDADTEA